MEEAMRWPMPLGEKPVVLQMGVSTHGATRVEHYRLPRLWSVHFYRYFGQVRVNGQALSIEPGCAGIAPPDAALEYRYRGPSTHVFAHFALPASHLTPSGDTVFVPAMQHLGNAFDALYHALEQAVGAFALQPRRAEARLWDVLWELAQDPLQHDEQEEAVAHPAVREALRIIEMRLGEPLCVAALAREVDVSHTHLTRLWRQARGTTVVEHIRRRRVERARHLLAHSTLPVKAIAAQVGIRDLQSFNKVMRRELGVSPRALRERHHL